MASAEGSEAENALTCVGQKKRTPEQASEWERVTKAKIAKGLETSRAEFKHRREQALVLENEVLSSRNALLESEACFTEITHYENLVLQDENEQLKASLESTGLVQDVQTLETELEYVRDLLCSVRGDLVRCESKLRQAQKDN
jgi:hypothetical protein